MRRVENVPLPPVRLNHLAHLMTPFGIWQHTRYAEPWVEHGFSIDDQARALIVGVWLYQLMPTQPVWLVCEDPALPEQLIETCLRYIEQAQLSNGRFHNFRSAEGEWLDEVGSDDSFGRTVWALQTLAQALPHTEWAGRARKLLELALPHATHLKPSRTIAFLLMEETEPHRLHALGRVLAERYLQTREPDWRWFEPFLTYDNPRIPQALLRAGLQLQNPKWILMAREAFEFLAEVTFSEVGYFNPIGSDGWYFRGKMRAQFDQQPICAGATVEAFLDAWQGFERYKPFRRYAQRALMWYHGENAHQIALYDPETGDVYDGLNALGVNLNRGAESVISYLMARIRWEVYTRS